MGDENAELQEEELEVLKSIYEGDELYSEQSPTRHQYKYGENAKSRSFVLEISWNSNYPTEAPDVNLDAFYNNHLLPEARDHIIQAVKEESEQYLGMSMTYSLFEWVKESFDTLIEKQPETIDVVVDKIEKKLKIEDPDAEESKKKSKGPSNQMTKAQKRRMWDKGGAEEERTRGWDWIDVVKHLHQTGGKDDEM